MGYLDKTSMTVTATFTKRGREILANAISGENQNGEHIITKFALGDDEIDYALWDETQSSNLEGRMIDNMPLLEGFVNQQEIMNSFVVNPPPMPALPPVINVDVYNDIVLEGFGSVMHITPTTDNFSWEDDDGTTQFVEEYEFFIEQDNLFEMYNPFTSPSTNFTMNIYIGDAPLTDFTMSVASPTSFPPIANFTMTA